jgi:integrase
VLRKGLNQSLRYDLVQRNVATMVDSPKLVKKEYLSLSRERVFKFLEVCQGHPLECAFLISLTCAVGVASA